MDHRPLGPRQPDKRHAAYESIFGRPGVAPHQTLPPSNYPQSPPLQHVQQYPYQQHQQYQGDTDRRTSYNSLPPSIHSPHGYQPQGPPNTYRQSILGYPNNLAPPNSTLSRARSIASNPSSVDVNTSQPDGRPSSNTEVVSQQGLTPAQAYQAQVYLNSPAGPQHKRSPGPDRTSYQQPQNGGPSRQSDVPKLGVALQQDDGRLNLDFGGSNSDQGTDEGSSELPWTRPERSAPKNAKSQPHSHRSSTQPTSVPLLVDTTSTQSVRSSVVSASPMSSSIADQSTLVDHASMGGSSRRSSESARTMPRLSGPRYERTAQDRSMSMSAASNSMRSMRNTHDQKHVSRPAIPPLQEGRNSPNSVRIHTKKTPIVYPALLSRVAEAFRDRIPITDRIKDGLTYKDSFDGREAVDKIAYIIKTTDRNLALLLGRALDAQKFFHDVTYDHRLRDSASELYQFRTKLPSPFVSGELPNPEDVTRRDSRRGLFPPPMDSSGEGKDGSASPVPSAHVSPDIVEPLNGDEVPLPSGVFTLLTDCYSPTCSRDQLCYSIACPRRLEQQARLNMKPQPGLSKQISRESLGDVPDAGTLWVHSVPQEIVNSVSDVEKKRQEAINEVIYTERDFVRDMEYLRDCWINRLKEDDIIPKERRTDFLAQVFWNIHDIIAVNTRLRDALNKRQKSYAVVERIGDLFLDAVPHFGPFVSYGAHQLYGKYEFEKEKNSNPAFAQFVEITERLPESRKLELNAYLTKPTTRLARYPLLLEAVLKQTPDDSPDKAALTQVVSLVRSFLGRVNTESGKTENRFNLIQLDQQLIFRHGEEVDLRLNDEGREMIHKGPLNKRDGELHVYLFDHALLLTKLVKTKPHEQYKVYRRPIPLELLLISASEDSALVPRNSRSPRGMPHVVAAVTTRQDPKAQFWINFMHLGRKSYHIMLWANSALSHRKWVESITKQQQMMRERSMVFDTVTLSEGFFSGPNKVNCAAPYSGGRRVVYGTDDGVYISDLRDPNREPVKVLGLLDVNQVDVLEDYQLLIVLSERQVITFPLDALDPIDPMAGLKRAKRISSHTSFFKAGFCLGRVLVCIVKSSQLSSTFKTLEPIDQNIRGRSKPTFRKLLQGGNDTLKLFREFYIPVESTSIHYLKTKMCVGCSRGFEIVDLESLDTQGLLDPNDESLEFVRKRENLRPMSIYRIHNEFLLCYDEFAFYVNKNGRRSRKDFMIHWAGVPTGFALHEPYVLAFEPTFVEVWHIESGLMSQVIQGSNLRLLFADTPPSVTNGSTSVYHNAAYPSGYEYNHRNSHPTGYNGYGFHHICSVGRNEILMVSDDRVLAVRISTGLMSDSASLKSLPR
ncbi:CNH domain-containing protein [Infundibulicybe gibba]|nr:CNH domain-containing protein [Infundibulicybe gibba]